jgi:hypothetical protein
MKKIGFILIFILCINNANAWGSKGHKIVVEVAKKYLDKAIIDSVNYYLNGMSWEDASVWMDEMRSDKSYDYMKPWHYVNVEKDKTYVESKDNVISELQIVIAQLKNKESRDKEKINLALRILFHLIGDIHQPLHCGYADDKGGNTIDVIFNTKKTNLHKVWDSDIIEKYLVSTEDCFIVLDLVMKQDVKNIKKGDPISWMNDSRAFLPQVYNITNGEIDKAYIDKNVPAIVKQLSRAGLRLAEILEETFKK